MTKVTTRPETDLTVVTEECHLEVEVSMDRIIEEYHSILTVIEMTLGEEIIGRHKFIEIRIIEVDVEMTTKTTIETITEITVKEEVEVCLGREDTQVILKGMIEVVADQDQV